MGADMKQGRGRTFGLVVGLCVLTMSGRVQARLYNYEDIPLGERAFGMGNANMAVPGDVGGIYFNPSILALNEHPQVSASLSAYARIDTRTGEYVSLFTSARDNISRGGFIAVPSMVGGNLRTGAWSWGGAVLVPTSFKNSGTNKTSKGGLSSFEGVVEATWLGAFAARRLNARHSFGIAFFYVSRSNQEKFLFLENPAAVEMRFIEETYSSNGLVSVLGGTYEWRDNLRLGYSLRLPPWHWGGKGVFSDATSGVAQQNDETFRTTALPLPWRLSTGLAWQVNPKLLLAADLHFYGSLYENPSSSGHEAFLVSAHEVLNFALGAEYMGWPGIGLRMGIFSNFSSAGTLSRALSVLNDKVHMGGATAAIVFDKPTGSISLGGYVQGGQGVSTPVSLEQAGMLVPRSNYIYGFVVASTYKF